MIHYILAILITIGLLLDVIATLYVVRRGGTESNWLPAWLARHMSLPSVLVVTHLVLAIALWCLLPRLAVSTLVLYAIGVGLVVAWNLRNVQRQRRARL